MSSDTKYTNKTNVSKLDTNSYPHENKHLPILRYCAKHTNASSTNEFRN